MPPSPTIPSAQRASGRRAGPNTVGISKPPRSRQNHNEMTVSALNNLVREVKNERQTLLKDISNNLMNQTAQICELNANIKMHFELDRELREEMDKRNDERSQKRHEELLSALQTAQRPIGPLNPSDGNNSNPKSTLWQSARFVLGDETQNNDIMRFLNQKVSPEGSRSSLQKVYSYISPANGRALEPIRNELIKAFRNEMDRSLVLPNLPSNDCEAQDSDAEHNVDNVTAREAVDIAKELFDSGSYKTDDAYNDCWAAAWKGARRKCRAQIRLYVSFLKDFNSESVPTLPIITTDVVEKKDISIFSLGFLHMKVARHMQDVCNGERGGIKRAHSPHWGREVRALDRKLKLFVSSNSLESVSVKANGLNVKRLLSEEEYNYLEEHY
ncbi:hypothetical protein FGB62_294g012 [Gracilaria domingensis]|nr:hypothetical protein FGB62_294g05 [Gracilaria domingensis]KAI0557500.1 hypothetical protein FGB62_294g012 [Gracilaria domingensis]